MSVYTRREHMKRNLNDSDEEFSLDVPNPDEEFTLDVPVPAPVNTRGDVVHHQARPVSIAEQILPPTQPDRAILNADYGRNSSSLTGYEVGSHFSSETVLTAIFIWNALVTNGGFPLDILELIFNYTIQVFHLLENAVYIVTTDSPISVTALSDNRTRFFQTNPLTLWDAPASKKSKNYSTSNASKLASFPVFMTMVFDNILTLDKNFQRSNQDWLNWHRATQRILRSPRNFGGVILPGTNFTHYYVSSGELMMVHNSVGVSHHIAIFDAPQTYFFLRRTDGTFEQYQFNPYGPKKRLFLTVISENPELVTERALPGFSGINTVPRMEHLRELYPKSLKGIGGYHQEKEPKFFTFYNPM